MARGESQTLLIWTVIFLIFSLIMIIVAVVMRSKYTEAAGQLADATQKNSQLTTEVSTLKTEGGRLREMIGYADANMPVADIETAFDGQLKAYAPTLPKEGASFLSTLKDLSDSYRNQVSENKTLSDDNSKQLTEINLHNANKEELRKELQNQVDAARNDLKKTQDNHRDQLDKFKEINQKLQDDVKVTTDHATAAIDEATKQRDAANVRSTQILEINKNLTTTVAEMESPVPTYTSANILWVSSDSTMVRVNLGSNHGLRPRMPFSVYATDAKEISVDSSKGKIEITKIIDGNTAEARVTEDILINPIIPGDAIYTPVWKPGQNIHVALSSGLDLDGDGVSDPHKAIMLIKMCGGEVDAYIDDLTGEIIDENGKMAREAFLVGQIGEDTRYLITGNKPGQEASESLSNAYREMENSAKDHGLTVITLKDMLNLMGQRPQSQKVGFGKGNRTTNTYEMEPGVVNQRMPGQVSKNYQDPEAGPDTNNKTPVSPLFNQRKVTNPTGTVSPLFKPRTAPAREVESK